MGKETVKNTYVLQEDENIGTVQIADEVVAIIASLAATEVQRHRFIIIRLLFAPQRTPAEHPRPAYSS